MLPAADSWSKHQCFCELCDPESVEASSSKKFAVSFLWPVSASYCRRTFVFFPEDCLDVINQKCNDILFWETSKVSF